LLTYAARSKNGKTRKIFENLIRKLAKRKKENGTKKSSTGSSTSGLHIYPITEIREPKRKYCRLGEVADKRHIAIPIARTVKAV
jgi:hypothetical protein